jgi:DNA polymerase I-like protein with 3'-5' exonuclease and polymerase domains
LVRQAFIPLDEDYEIAEFDLKGAEVCVSYCYHQDPTMGDYLRRGHDYHKDLACQCYMLDKSQVTKLVRGEAKADFVFSSFYGSWWPNIATKMWEAIETDNLCRVDGVGLLQHLAEKGITKLGTGDREPEPGTFQAHIANVYDDFWHNRFKRYSEWKDEVWQDYLAKGYCQSHTGFIYQGLANRREVINYRIQGSSFHCLLWCLIEVNEWLLAHNMKSRIIGQIHDSIVMDIHRKEHDDVVWFVTDTIRRRIREEWPWIIIQLEAEAAKSGENWYAKKEFELPKTTTAA